MKLIFMALISLGLASNIAFATERNYANLKSKEIQVKDNGAIGIQRLGKLKDTIVLIKGISKSVNLSQFSDSQVHQEIIQFFERLVTQYKFRQSDRSQIGFAVLGDGWFGKGLYQLEISEIIKLNNRDFGKNDMNLIDSNGSKYIPLKVLFSHLRVINPSSLTENKSATTSIRNYVQGYKFGGSIGIGESMVENSWNGIYDKKERTGAFSMFPDMPEDKGSYYYYGASCKEGGAAFVNVEKDSNNVFCWGGQDAGCEVGIGVEAAMRKGCGGA